MATRIRLGDDDYLRSAKAAHKQFLQAKQDAADAKILRSEIFKTANQEGKVSLRRIAEAVGLSHSAVQKAIDGLDD